MSKPRKSYYWWIIGKVLYALVGLAILVMTLFLVWRVFFSGALPEEAEILTPNTVLKSAYDTHGNDLKIFTQEQSTHTRDDHNYGYFAVPRFVFIPEANQVQVVFRYNNSTLKAVQQDYGLAEVPAKGEEIFDVSLVQIDDLTPEDESDNVDGSNTLAKQRITPTSRTVTSTALYTYFIYVFDCVAVTDSTVVVYFDIYYEEDIDYQNEAYGTLRLYHRDSARIDVALTSDDKKALNAFVIE